MAFYYKIEKPVLPLNGIQVYETKVKEPLHDQSKTYDFSKHVLIELLDDVTPETKLWEELGLVSDKSILHKRMMVDSHRVHCRRAVVVCADASYAKNLAQRVSQAKIMKRCVCAAVVQDLLFDFKLFEKQILRLGDKRPQHQLLYITDLNRCREPALLAQYLRDLFSPFGTVLSVFVSEDKDGFAHPEGVVKFAHLSEAFAAELAYDQFVIGMERLSVTTHHNILLSQCDLRVRLREAQGRHSETLNNTPSPNINLFYVPEVGCTRNSSVEKEYAKNVEYNLLKRSTVMDITESPYVFSDSNISQSTELDDVLKNPCKNNLIDCLKSMALCSDSSVNGETISDSQASTCVKTQNSKSSRISFNNTEPSRVTLPLKEQDWSSKISHWIADIPNNNFSQSSNAMHLSKDAVNTTDCASSHCSFITCDNGTQDHVDSPLSSPSSVRTRGSLSHSNETLLNVTSSPGSFHTTRENLADTSMCASDMSLTQPQCSLSNSISQKGKDSFSSKLSLKSQRLNSLLFSKSRQDLLLSGISESHLTGLSDSKLLISPVVRVKRLSSAEIQNLCSQESQKDALRPSKHQCFSSGHDEVSAPSLLFDKENHLPVNLISTRRSSRMSSRQSSCHSNLSEKNKSQLELAPKSTFPYKSDSPLRAWLKNDLLSASNVFENAENSRKIVCATASKNVLAHVGCSSMTCDICYPGSTNLLFGCH